jgi:DNA-binding transcriptional MocR family regulator
MDSDLQIQLDRTAKLSLSAGKAFRARSSNLLKTGSFSSLVYPDRGGEFEPRREIAGDLSISRNLHCFPEQVFITSGYSSGLGLALRVSGKVNNGCAAARGQSSAAWISRGEWLVQPRDGASLQYCQRL